MPLDSRDASRTQKSAFSIRQIEITMMLDSLPDKIQRLEAHYQQKLTTLDDLKKSLLHRAFRETSEI